MSQTWILLIYRIPTQPSRLRLQIWRRLQALGVYYLQDAVCVLPDRPELEVEMRDIGTAIRQMGGTATLFSSHSIQPEEDCQVVDGFKQLADDRYAAIVKRIDEAMATLEKDVAVGDLEAAEESLKRERVAYLRAHRIAYFGGTTEATVEKKIEALRRLLDDIRDALLS